MDVRAMVGRGSALILLTLIAPAADAGDVEHVPQQVPFSLSEPHFAVYRTAAEVSHDEVLSAGCDEACIRTLVAPIDFARNHLVLIATGSRSQDLYDVEVYRVTEEGHSVHVYYRELRYGPSTGDKLCGVVMVMPRPTTAVLIPASDKQVEFRRSDPRVVSCE
jgi:hypothetical protein